MAIPDYQQVMLPLLTFLSDGEQRQVKEITEWISSHFALSEDERSELIPSGNQTVIANRVAWAKTYLKKAGVISQPRRGVVELTERGRQLLLEDPKSIDSKSLSRYPEYVEFRSKKSSENANDEEVLEAETIQPDETPHEVMESAHTELRNALADEVLEQVKECSPAFFERLVVDLLVSMGYGGSIKEAGRAIGRSGDGGIDGIINEDKLGLDIVVIQAKRWTSNSVGRPDVQAFAGSMEPHRAKKGVFITTSNFTKEAHEYVRQAERKIILIDGETLAKYMIDYNVGVSVSRTYVVKRLDTDYFEEQWQVKRDRN